MERESAQTGAASEADDSAESEDATTAGDTNAKPSQNQSQADASVRWDWPFPTSPPLLSPSPGLLPGHGTISPEVCETRVFDSLTPPDNITTPNPCTYWVADWPKVGNPKYLRVQVDGKNVPLGQAAYGWLVADAEQGITLLGGACEAAQAGASITIGSECTLVPLN